MDLEQIVSRVSEGLSHIDRRDEHFRANQRSGEIYLTGVPSLVESEFTKQLATWWNDTHPEDFKDEQRVVAEVKYNSIPRAKCDLVIMNQSGHRSWAIEVKRIQFVGNNGKNNDFGLAKVLSPYNKDRSLIHDVNRLRIDRMANKSAVLSYGFEYSFETCEVALQKHPGLVNTIQNIRQVCKSENPTTGEYLLAPMTEMLDDYLTRHNLASPVFTKSFSDAWAHPCGGQGQISGWQVTYP